MFYFNLYGKFFMEIFAGQIIFNADGELDN